MDNEDHKSRACKDKTKYLTSSRARNIAIESSIKTGSLITYYNCRYCHNYHIGHISYRREKNIRRSLELLYVSTSNDELSHIINRNNIDKEYTNGLCNNILTNPKRRSSKPKCEKCLIAYYKEVNKKEINI